MEIYPIALTTVNWPLFINKCQTTLGYSPTKGLDNTGIPIKDPAAYLACFNLENKPLESLRSLVSIANHHFMISFLIIGYVPKEFYIYGHLKYYEKIVNHKCITILSGTIYEWLQTIEYIQHLDIEIRKILNEIVNILSSTWLKEIFSIYERITYSDGSYILKRK